MYRKNENYVMSESITQNDDLSVVEIPQSFKWLTHTISIAFIALLFTLVSLGEAEASVKFMGFLIFAGYILILYAIAGGFDWQLEKISTGRGLIFLILSGLIYGIFLYGLWIATRWIISKIYGIPYAQLKGSYYRENSLFCEFKARQRN